MSGRPRDEHTTIDLVGPASDDTFGRLCDATIRCIARHGVGKTTLDDVARDAGVSRATLYRVVPGGREGMFNAAFGRELQRFFTRLADELDRHDDLEDMLVVGVGEALRFLADHAALRTVIAVEPQLLVPQLAFHRLDPLLQAVTAFAVPRLAPHVGDDAPALAEQLLRLVLSYTLHPSDRVDPHDDGSIRRLVCDHVLPGVQQPA